MFRRFRKQLRRTLQRQRHSDSPVIHEAEIQHRQRISGIRRLLIQFRGIDQILLHAVADFIAHAQIALPRGILQICRLAVQLRGTFEVPWNADGGSITETQPVSARSGILGYP